MSSFTYNGHDFSAYVSAELVEPVGHVVEAETAEVPGRPGRLLFSGDVEPLVLRLRVFMDNHAFTTAELAEVRRLLRGWLVCPSGGALVVPGEPELEWHDAVCTGVSDWTSLFSDGSAVVTFTCFDPIAYGKADSSALGAFNVGGSWGTWPTVGMNANAGSAVQVTDSFSGAFVRVEGGFSAGDAVLIDMEGQTVAVNGSDATGNVTLGSDFFSLRPGNMSLAFSGCSEHSVRWTERWA